MAFYTLGYSGNSTSPNFRVYRSRVNCNKDGIPSFGPAELDTRWYPQRVEWSSNGQDSIMVLKRRSAGSSESEFENPDTLDVSAGEMFTLIHDEGGKSTEMFCGYAGQGSFIIQSNPDMEFASVVVYGPEVLVKGCAVTGAWHISSEAYDALSEGRTIVLNRDQVVATHMPVIFNESGYPNASVAQWSLADGCDDWDCCVFVAGTSDGWFPQGAHTWNAYQAVKSLVVWFDNRNFISPQTDWYGIKQVACVEIGEVNVTGMNLLEAIKAVLLPAGLGFNLDLTKTGGGYRLNIWPLHGRAACSGPYLGDRNNPQSVNSPEGKRCMVQRIDFVRDNHNIINDVTVVGAPQRVDTGVIFGPGLNGYLKPFWNPQQHDLSAYKVDGSLDPANWTTQQTVDFCSKYSLDYKGCDTHALRSFVWNEDGGLSPLVEPAGNVTKYGVDGKAIRRPRPFGDHVEPQDVNEDITRPLNAYVEMGIYIEPNAWVRIPAVIWKDRAGFTITRNNLHGWFPYATEEARGKQSYYSGTLFERYAKYSYIDMLSRAFDESLGFVYRFMMLRITGSVETDNCLTGRAEYQVDSSWPIRRSKVVYLANRFRNTNFQDSFAAAEQYALQIRDSLEDSIGHGSLVLRGVDHCYGIGQAIKRTRGRNVDLSLRGREIDDTNKYSPVIVRKIWDMSEEFYKTELLLETPALQVR